MMSGPADVDLSAHSEDVTNGGVRTVIPRGFEYPDTLLYGRTSISLIVWRVNTWKKRDVDAEVVLCHASRLANSLAKGIRRRLRKRGKDT